MTDLPPRNRSIPSPSADPPSEPPDSAYWSPEDPRWAQVEREGERPDWFDLTEAKLKELLFAIQDIPVEELGADNLDMLLSTCESLRLALKFCRMCRDDSKGKEPQHDPSGDDLPSGTQ